MKLTYFVPNLAWAFTFGHAIVKLHGADTFFKTRRDAVKAAEDRGLKVDKDGSVTVRPAHEYPRGRV